MQATDTGALSDRADANIVVIDVPKPLDGLQDRGGGQGAGMPYDSADRAGREGAKFGDLFLATSFLATKCHKIGQTSAGNRATPRNADYFIVSR
jgi:hypothetical protein